MIETVNVLETDFGPFRAPEWVTEVPRCLQPYEREDGETVMVMDIDRDAPEGKAFWHWFRTAVNPKAQAHYLANEDNFELLANEPRPF